MSSLPTAIASSGCSVWSLSKVPPRRARRFVVKPGGLATPSAADTAARHTPCRRALMARARLLKPGFFTNEDLVELPPAARLLFAGLWTLADREGRLEDRPKRIKLAVLPYDDVDVD